MNPVTEAVRGWRPTEADTASLDALFPVQVLRLDSSLSTAASLGHARVSAPARLPKA